MHQEMTPVPRVSPQPHNIISSQQSNQLRVSFWSMSLPERLFCPKRALLQQQQCGASHQAAEAVDEDLILHQRGRNGCCSLQKGLFFTKYSPK